jgi:glycosyltransferase involved in cell wall biosynthesis
MHCSAALPDERFTENDQPVIIPLAPTRVPQERVATLHLINGQHYSGAERVQDLLGLRLPEHGFQVDFACLKSGQFGPMRQSQSARLHVMPMRNRWDLTVLRRLRALVEQYEYRIIHAHTPRTVMIGSMLARRTGIPLIFHVHSPTSRDSTRAWQNRLNHWIEKRSLRSAVAMIAVSHSLRQHMLRMGHTPDRLVVVPNGVPTAALSRRPAPQGTWTLGTVALFRPRKGIEVLIEALAACVQRGMDVQLRAVGPFETPEYERHIRQLVDRLGMASHIAWTGFAKDVRAEFARMDVFILPSLFGEGLPMVVLEAMASGVPVIATRVEGIPEAIRDGIDGLLVEPGKTGALSSAVGRLIGHPQRWSDLRRDAHGRQERYFSDQSMARGVADVYRMALDKHAADRR